MRGATLVRMEISAHAKINLFLEVLGRRPDGFHEIRSVLTPITLSDRLVIEPTDGLLELLTPDQVQLEGMPDPVALCPAQENLVFQAARLLREKTGCRQGVRISLEKLVPVAGGLGGGSADAAAVLTALNRLWKTGLSRTALMELSSRLGCDIPALVHGGAVCMTGRGELVQPVQWRAAWRPWVLLVNPGFGVSTGDIYGRYRPDLTSTAKKTTFKDLLAALNGGDAQGLAAGLHNDLQSTVFDKYPLLEMLAGRLVQLGAAAVLLSGSGATIFALVRSEAHGRELAAELRRAMDCQLWTSVAQIAGDLRPEF